MRNLLSNFILPIPIFWFLISLAFYYDINWKKRVSTKIILFAFAFLFIVSTPFIPNLLVKSLEQRFEPISLKTIDKLDKPVHVLILGGGHTNDSSLPANDQLSSNALVRLSEGIRIHTLIPKSILVTSGYGGREDIPQAEVLYNAAVYMGVDASKIRMQTEPVNTWMEANEYKKHFSNDSIQLILVTSAIHMPRAMYLFHKAGLNPIPAPTNHILKKGKKTNYMFWVPNSANISKMEAVIHEYVGLIFAFLWY